MTVYLITGVNKGLGSAFVENILSNPENLVIGTVRNKTTARQVEAKGHKNLRLLTLDISKPYANFVEEFKKIDTYSKTGIDTLILNAGAIGTEFLANSFDYDPDQYADILNINVGGAVKTYKASYPYLFKHNSVKHKKIIFLSSIVASTGLDVPMSNAYGASKSAINHFGKQVSIENSTSKHEVQRNSITLLLHPGYVDTDMSAEGKVAFGTDQYIEPWESAAKLIKIIDNASIEQSGKFFSEEGKELPW